MAQRSTPAWLPARSPVSGLRRRQLTFVEVLAQAVATLAPAAGMVVVPSILLVEVGAGTLPAVLTAIALVLLVGWCLGQFGRRMAAVGGTYSYTAKGLGPVGALVGGWALLVAYAAVAMAALVGASVYLAGLFGLDPGPEVVAVLGIVLGLVGTACAVRGIRLTARLALGLEVASIALVLSVLAVLLVGHEAAPGTAAPVVDSPVRWGAVAAGMVLAVTAFMGFESAATLGVEARRPLSTVPRAVLCTPAVAGILFVAAITAQVVLLRAAPLDVLTSPVPLARLADRDGLGVVRRLLDLGIATSFFACFGGATNALGRVLFTMGREGVLPAALGRTHHRFDTPHRALALVLPVVVVVPVAALLGGVGPRAVLTGLLTASAFGYTVSYVLVSVAMPLFLAKIGELTARAAVAGALAGLVGLVGLVGALAAASGTLTVVFLLTVLPGVAWPLLLRRFAPDRLSAVGVYDQATMHSVLPGLVPPRPRP